MIEIVLGTKVKDSITGFTGIATSRTVFLNGCVQYCVEPPVGKDGKTCECQWIDEQRLTSKSRVRTGGPVRKGRPPQATPPPPRRP